MEEWTPEILKNKLDSEEPLFILDIRNSEVFARNHLEGKSGITICNVPYASLVEEKSKDIRGSITQSARKKLSTVLPQDKPILVVCNRGRSSVPVFTVLKELGYQAYSLAGGMLGWENYQHVEEVISTEKFSVYQISRVARGCLSYLISIGNKAVLIDPSRHIQFYIDFLQKHSLEPEMIVDTHAHADHLSGGRFLASVFHIPYYLHPYDGIHPTELLPASYSYHPLWNHGCFKWGDSELQSFHVPGHTLGNQAFLLNGAYLFSGDSIFINSISRPDLGGHAQAWSSLHYQSLQKLLALPDETIVLPGHFSHIDEANEKKIFSRTLGDLKKSNEGLIMAQKSLEEFNQYILNNLPHIPQEYRDIKKANLGLIELDEEQASALESGKNICALSR